MTKDPYTVHLVLDPDYGERLRSLPEGEPVWLVDSEVNRHVSQVLRRERVAEDHLVSYTTFKQGTADSPEECLLGVMSELDLHHGEMSHEPPYSVGNVIGVAWSDKIARELAEYGFEKHDLTSEGFVTRKGIGQPDTGCDS